MTFITLMKAAPGYTDQVLHKLRAGELVLPEPVEVLAWWVTFGQYDFVAIWNAPDQRAANMAVRQLASEGLVATETMLAQRPEEFVRPTEEDL
jgi:uncharacterized protein with GYD domain